MVYRSTGQNRGQAAPQGEPKGNKQGRRHHEGSRPIRLKQQRKGSTKQAAAPEDEPAPSSREDTILNSQKTAYQYFDISGFPTSSRNRENLDSKLFYTMQDHGGGGILFGGTDLS